MSSSSNNTNETTYRKGYAPVKQEFLVIEATTTSTTTNNVDDTTAAALTVDKKRPLSDNTEVISTNGTLSTEVEIQEPPTKLLKTSENEPGIPTTTTTTTTTTITTSTNESSADSTPSSSKSNNSNKRQRGQHKGRTRANQTSHLKQASDRASSDDHSAYNQRGNNTEEGDSNSHHHHEQQQLGEKNKLGFDVMKQLRRKNGYPFEKAIEVVKHVEDYVKWDVKKQEKLNNSQFQMLKIRARQVEQMANEATQQGKTPDLTLDQFYETVSNKDDVKLLRLQYVETKYKPNEIRKVDFRGKTTLAPLTTVGNLPFRRICKGFGVDVTIGEMSMATNILKGQLGEVSLWRRHESEDCFGVQLAGNSPEVMCKIAQLIEDQFPDIDFVDINCGCPIDLLCNQGMGSGLMEKRSRLQGVVRGMKEILSIPLSVKTRTGIKDNKLIAHNLYPQLKEWGVDVLTLHGRTRQQRYTKEADWSYIAKCAALVRDENLQVIGNGDVMSYEDFNRHTQHVDSVMIGRGALIKPWLFTEIKEQRHWDITANERLDMLKDFVKFGYDHYGSDEYGIATTRRYLLEWLSFLHRYIPIGLMERYPQQINERPPRYFGRNDLETLMASGNVQDWVKISNLIMPPPTDDFTFVPKHKSNSYEGG